MLAGKLPFEATTVQETMIKRLNPTSPPRSPCRAPISGFPRVCIRCSIRRWRATPVDRYQTVVTVRRRYRRGDRVAAAPPPPSPHTRSGADTEGRLSFWTCR